MFLGVTTRDYLLQPGRWSLTLAVHSLRLPRRSAGLVWALMWPLPKASRVTIKAWPLFPRRRERICAGRVPCGAAGRRSGYGTAGRCMGCQNRPLGRCGIHSGSVQRIWPL